MNGGDNRVSQEENPETVSLSSSRQVMSQSQSLTQFQPDSHRVNGNLLNSQSLSTSDFKTLESSFDRLSVSDSSVRQNGNQILNNRYDQVINGGVQPNGHVHHCELELQRLNQDQRSPSENGFVNGHYGCYARGPANLTNGFTNGVPSSSRNRVSYQNSSDNMNVYRYTSGFNNSWRSNERVYGSNSLENGGGSSILAIAIDVVFSEHLRRRIDGSSQEMFDMIFNDLINHVCDLMMDPFGISVFQSLMRKSSSEQVTKIIDIVTQNNYQFYLICSDSHGNVAILSLLEYINFFRHEHQITRLVEAIRRVTPELTRKADGHKVILSCFSRLHVSQFKIILDVIVDNCVRIACDQNGCHMIQKSLRIDCPHIWQHLTGQIITNALELCTDNYGNYVVQYLVLVGNQYTTELLMVQLLGNYGYLSRNKYGSHVVQKLLEVHFNNGLIIYELLKDIDTLVVDAFGNYVIQSAWANTSENVREHMRNHIIPNIELMKCNMYGSKVIKKLGLDRVQKL